MSRDARPLSSVTASVPTAMRLTCARTSESDRPKPRRAGARTAPGRSPSMDLKAFWLGWRRDIIRFVALCSAALVLGLVINHLVGRARQARQQLTGMLPRGLGGLMSGLDDAADSAVGPLATGDTWTDRKSTRLNSSHLVISYAVFCLKKKIELMAVFISMRCTLCGHFLQVALTLILVVGYAIAAS